MAKYDEQEAKIQEIIQRDKEKSNPILDWLISVVVLIGILAALAFIFGNKDYMKSIADRLFTTSGLIALVVVFVIIGIIQSIRQQIKIAKIRNEIKAKMLKEWGRKE